MAATHQQIYNATMDTIEQLTLKGATSVSINGKTWTAQDLGKLTALADWALSNGAVSSSTPVYRATTAVIEFGPANSDCGCERRC